MAVKRWTNLRPQYVDTVAVGNPPLNAGRLFFYSAGTSTKQNTYTDSTGATPNSNPVVLNSAGEPSVEIWLTVGTTYKVGLAVAGVDDPPASFLWTEDNISAINDVTVLQPAQWQTFAGIPTFVSGTSFTVLGDQRQIFDQGRRVQTMNTAGAVYGSVSAASTFDGTRTTVTLTNDTGALDAGLSAIFYGILSAVNSSIPPHASNIFAVQDNADNTKRAKFDASGIATATTRVLKLPDASGALAVNTQTCNGRLSLTTAVPITTADVLAATTIFFTPYAGNGIALFDGVSNWNTLPFAEKSIAVPATTITMYDVFAFNNSGVVALEILAWTNDTTRTTALVLQDGALVKSGATTRRYLGSFRTTGVAGQTEDSVAKRYVWNYYNRVLRLLKAVEATSSWTQAGGAVYRQANSAAANQVEIVIGFAEVLVDATVLASGSNSGSFASGSGIGIDSSTVNSALTSSFFFGAATPATGISARYLAYTAIGKHDIRWLEISGGNTTTWYGTNSGGSGMVQSGITASLMG